jgi:hypothetical protein
MKSPEKWQFVLKNSLIRTLIKDHSKEQRAENHQYNPKQIISQKSGSVFLLLRQILARSAKYKATALLSAFGYWLLYGYSTGMYFYYSFDVTQYLKASGTTNPYFIPPVSLNDLAAVYNSGVVWFPTSHLQLNFMLGPTFFSILLSVLFSMSILLLIYSFRFKGMNRKQQGLAGFFGVIPALFSGGCCAVPVATLLLGSIVPSAVLANIEFGDPLLLNLLIVILILSSIYYTARKIIKSRNSCQACGLEFESGDYQ